MGNKTQRNLVILAGDLHTNFNVQGGQNGQNGALLVLEVYLTVTGGNGGTSANSASNGWYCLDLLINFNCYYISTPRTYCIKLFKFKSKWSGIRAQKQCILV
jgi:hypothetical protein